MEENALREKAKYLEEIPTILITLDGVLGRNQSGASEDASAKYEFNFETMMLKLFLVSKWFQLSLRQEQNKTLFLLSIISQQLSSA